ncbi:endoplasmic reticulum retaining receptor [Blastocystis sp. ATCC 50177/Nand II]|uniref:Endoplasmic reticulum retaining receptor n=1 Tax=Blastocystis sp. subtype 1 (strain ATCC 50177 / NandII) TaxID=478820 RepID=A0A196SE61_BLAHN|nr:endoplasmic reticulum retaining receptor [Blastocystis sp. ATCC 50177/Nand II]
MLEKVQRRMRKFDYKQYLKANRSNVLLWSSLVVFILFVYHFFSDGDFSFLLTLGSLVSCFGFLLIVIRCFRSKSVMGISAKSMECYAVVYFMRLIAIYNSSSYLPFDRSGDWLYHLIETTTFICVVLIIYLMKVPLKYTHNIHHDTWGQQYIRKEYTALLLILPSIICALIVHPQRSGKGWVDVAWAISMYLESVSILPQLHMFKKDRTGEIEAFTSHFVFAMFISKLLNFFFWMGSWSELNGDYGFISRHFAGLAIILSQVAQLGLMASYVFYYLRSAIYDSPMVLPTSMDMRAD